MARLSSGYQVELFPAELTSGALALVLVARRTFRVADDSTVVVPLDDADQPPPLMQDRYEGGDATTVPPTLETDLVPEKARVDVIVLGKAYAPGGRPTPEFTCAVQVGRKREELRILGPRRAVWQPLRKQDGKMQPQPPRFTEPEPVREVPLSLTLAYGGWTWLVPDAETLRVQKEVARVMAEEAPKPAPAADRTTQDPAGGGAKAAGPGGAAQTQAAEESLKLGDGSEGYDAEGVRLWNAAASRDGTAVLTLDEFARQDLADQAKALRPSTVAPEQPRLRRNAAGEWLEVDDGAEILTDEALAQSRAEQPVVPVTAPSRSEVVLNPDGARQLGQDGDDNWDESLRHELGVGDARSAEARQKDEAARKKAEDAALAEFPRLPCPTNPFGVGFCVSNQPQVVARTRLPQIEHPLTPLTPQDFVRDVDRLETVPMPAGFGVLPRHARPRVDLAGPVPSALDSWQEQLEAQKQAADLSTREGVQALRAMEARQKPQPMQPGFYNAALPALQLNDLRGDEEVVLENLTPAGRSYFKLPARVPVAELDRGRGVERRDLRADTLIIDAEKAEVTLVWRAQFALGSWDELATYPHLVGHVLDLDLEDRRRDDELAAARRARGDGTQVLDLNALPDLPAAVTHVAKPVDDDGVLELPKMGSYVQAHDDGWAARADEAAAEAQARRQEEQRLLAWRAQKDAALRDLAAAEQAETARRAEIAQAVSAGKPVPPKGGGK